MSGFQPLQSGNSDAANYAQVNKMMAQLSAEQQTKTFKGAGGTNAVIQGKLPNGKYGTLYYEGTTARILIGMDPDGNMTITVSKPGYDVLGLY